MSDISSSTKLKLRIPDVTKPEKMQLLETAPSGIFEVTDKSVGQGHHGELVTATAVAWLTKIAVTALVAWLLKTTDQKKIRKVVVIEKPDGTIITMEVEIDLSKSEAPNTQVLEQINQLLSGAGLPELEN